MPTRRRSLLWGFATIVAALGVGTLWLYAGCLPTPSGPSLYVRYRQPVPLVTALRDLQSKGVVKNASAAQIYAKLMGKGGAVARGTFQVQPGMSISMVLNSLRHPVTRLIRLPEGYWAKRTGALLEKQGICAGTDYQTAATSGSRYAAELDFPIPRGDLEGYLFPDTYNLPPMIEPEEIVLKQLQAFERKIWIPAGKPKNLDRILTVASLVELEAKEDADRPMIAGVIENRLKRGMALQIDATVLFARGRWGLLSRSELSGIDSPYNTYLHVGLPPGPICSPTIKSVLAAMMPAKHDFLYYVAMPGGGHIFSRTLEEHNHNVRLRKAARRAEK